MRLAKLVATAALAALALAEGVRGQEPAQFDLPEGPGKEAVTRACAACHAITIVTSQRRDEAAWADTVDRMMARGAPVMEEDYEPVIQYLGAHFGTAATPTAAPAAPAAAPAAAAAKTP